MNPDEYTKLERVEREHWFYAGKREIVFHWLRKQGCLRPEQLLVDCGAGTGFFAKEASQFCNVIAVDDFEESLAIARRQLGENSVRKGSCTSLPFENAVADAVTALDVIEHVEQDGNAVKEMARILKPGGTMVITVPAFQALWSDWDVVLHHFRRYRRSNLLPLIHDAGLEIVHCNYVNVLVFPAVYAVRKLRTFRSNNGETAGSERAEEQIPGPLLNRFLRKTFVAPACQDLVRFPFGVGLLAVARKPEQASRS